VLGPLTKTTEVLNDKADEPDSEHKPDEPDEPDEGNNSQKPDEEAHKADGDHKDSDEADSLDSLISFFQRHYLVKNVGILTNSGKTSAVSNTQQKRSTHDNNSKPGGLSSSAFSSL